MVQRRAAAVVRSGIEFDVVFGPAYKGISLACATAAALFELGRDVPFAWIKPLVRPFRR